MATPKTTSQIAFETWTTIQMSLSGANNFGDVAPSDNLGGPGPYLVFDRGIWKYPQQTSGGRIQIPVGISRPLRLVNMMADFGASVTWSVTVADSITNTSGEPYPAAQAGLYGTGSIQVHGGTSRYVADNLDAADAGIAVLVWPGQKVFVTTAGASAPIVRLSFSTVVEGT